MDNIERRLKEIESDDWTDVMWVKIVISGKI
jgi:hypothetical protein